MNRNCDNLNIENIRLKEAKNKLHEKEILLNDLELKLKNEQIKTEGLTKQNNEVSLKLHQFQTKYSGENTLENLKNSIFSKESDMKTLT